MWCPQGSILGPLLFLIYINDIVTSSSILKFFLFADDTTIFFSSKPSTSIEKILNTELTKVNNWLISNKLSLNVGKSCFLKFSLLHQQPNITVKIANKPLIQKRVTKYLGVLIDDKLLWKDHIQTINTKLRKGIGILSSIKDFVTRSTLKSLYYSFIHPFIDYNILNWSSTYPSNLDCLKVSTKKAVRTILSKNKQEHALPLFKELNILPLDEFIKFRKGSHMWKLNNNLLPPSISTDFKVNHSDIIRRLNLSKFRLRNPRLEYTKRHISYSGVKLWNTEIPNELKNSSFLSCFKRNYRQLLLPLN